MYHVQRGSHKFYRVSVLQRPVWYGDTDPRTWKDHCATVREYLEIPVRCLAAELKSCPDHVHDAVDLVEERLFDELCRLDRSTGILLAIRRLCGRNVWRIAACVTRSQHEK